MSALVVRACQVHWDTHKDDCSGFVKAVAADLGIQLAGVANNIMDEVAGLPWRSIETGRMAEVIARGGNLVIGGLKAQPHGHVVVVVPGALNRGAYPPAWWGKLGGVGMQNATINWAWKLADCDRVKYAYLELPNQS